MTLVLVGAIKDEHKSSVAGMLLEAEQKVRCALARAPLLVGTLQCAVCRGFSIQPPFQPHIRWSASARAQCCSRGGC